MECILLNAAGQTIFVRDDMESGHWIQQEMNMTADFPFDPEKKIERGMRVAFRDPTTNGIEMFEVRIVVNHEPEHYQQITGEHICIAELTDEHINRTEITNQTAAQALATALTGTLWSVGTNTASGTQSADFSRGSVWDAVNTIKQNWNVYITPRVVISAAGSITGRYLDITPAEGTWRGFRVSVRKNLLDPAVTIDDEEVYTALYGYGGSVEKAQTSGDDTTQELTFADVVWTATADHPAKPDGQTYLEWPEKTAIYGRNGRPRFGYYQNGSISDANLLLEKTWESLKQSSEPKISIAGTCVDLYRLGYKDQPIRLHDLVIVEIEETGETFQKQIICCDLDLIDPTGSRIEIGDYIPNIVYINRDTDKKASGGGGGGRGRGSMTNLEDEDIKTWTEFIKTNEKIGMVVGTKNGSNYVKGGEITLAINADGGTTATIQADCIDIDGLIEALRTKVMYVKDIFVTGDVNCNGITATGDVACADVDAVDGSFSGALVVVGNIDGAAITGTSFSTSGSGSFGSLSVSGSGSFGSLSVSGSGSFGSLSVSGSGSFGSLSVSGSGSFGSLSVNGAGSFGSLSVNGAGSFGSLSVNGTGSFGSLSVNGAGSFGSLSVNGAGSFGSLSVNGTGASWQSYEARYCTLSNSHYFNYASSSGGTPSGTVSGYIVTNYTNTTIHYLGY